jgi:Protein phosphatase 2C
MNADSTFIIGSTHSICQDYAVASHRWAMRHHGLSEQESPYVILSDGCSSSPDTDIGARLLVKAANQIFGLCDGSDLGKLHKESARLALRWAKLVGVPAQSVDATLMSAHLIGDELIIGCSGDGVIVQESRQGILEVHAISCPSGYPFYPSYAHQPDRLDELLSNDRSNKELRHFRRVTADERLRLIDTSTSDSVTQVFRLKASDLKYVGIASDGIYSFFSVQESTDGRRTDAVPMIDILEDVWSFKTPRGAFVERRMKRFRKDCQVKGWYHADDLAIGVIHLGD